jgi:hypothetical protein
MHEDSKLLDHVNNVKVFVDQRACLEVPVLKSLPELYEGLITALETMPMNELMMEYVTTRLIHEMSK